MADPFVGQLTFIRVYSGQLKSGESVLNSRTQKTERIGRLLKMHANKREDIQEILAGDICAVVGLKNVGTGDTICEEKHPITLESITFAVPVISVAVEPKTKADQEKMGMALARLAQEDPTFKVHTDPDSGQTIISGMPTGWTATTTQGRMVGDYISTSYDANGKAHGVFATASAPTSGTNCSDVLDNCREPMDTFSTGLAASGSASSARDPVLFGGNGGNSSSLWNVVLNNGRKHRD